MKQLLTSTPLHLALILLCGALTYANTFGVPFVLDDLESIVDNPAIHSLGNFLPGGTGYDFHFRRWVVYFTLALNYRFGGLDVFGYHLVNLTIHLGSALLLYRFARLILRTPALATTRLAERAGAVALLAALFFVLHPVQTQAVTYVVQRLASLCTFFYLLALVLYLDARLGRERDGAHRPLLLATSCCAAVLAMFCKEIAFTLPLAALLCEATFFDGPWRRRSVDLAPLLATLPIVPLNTFLAADGAVQSLQAQTFTATPPLHYLLTQFRVIVTYLRLLLLPLDQNLDYDYPLYTDPFSAPVLLSLLLLLALAACALYLYGLLPPRRTAAHRPELRLLGFGILWFFLTLSVESSIIPLADVIFEHRLYLPLCGPALAFGVVASLGTASWRTVQARLTLVAAALVLLALGTAAWQRNRVWQSEISLWQDTVAKSPVKVRPLYNLGTILGDNGRPEEAIPLLEKTVKLAPEYADARHNLGRAYLVLGRGEEAVRHLTKAVAIDPRHEEARLNLASAYLRTGNPQAALPILEGARDRAPDRPEHRFNLGLAYYASGNLQAARQELASLNQLDPTLAQNLAQIIQRDSTIPPPR